MGHDQLQRGRDQAGTSPGLPTPIGGNDSRHNLAQERAVSPVFRPVGRGGGESHAARGAGKDRRERLGSQPIVESHTQHPQLSDGEVPPHMTFGCGERHRGECRGDPRGDPVQQRSRRGGLQRKFFISLLIVGILPGVAALIATYLYSTDSLKHSIGSSFQEIARSTAIRIATAVDTEIDRALQLASLPMVVRQKVELANQRYRGKSETEVRTLLAAGESAWSRTGLNGRRSAMTDTTGYLKTWVSKTDSYVRLVITDKRGALVATTDPHTPYLNGDRAWWQEAVKEDRGTAYVSSLRNDPVLNEYVFDVAVPIRGDDDQEPLGVVGLVIRRNVLMDTILPIRVGETGHGMLLDTEGTPLICPVLPPTAHLIHDALLNQLARDEPLWFVADDDAHGGHNSIVGAAPVRFRHRLTASSLGGKRWFAFVRQQPEETYAPIYSLLVTVGLIGFGLVVGLASLGFVVGRRTVSPILALRRETEALRREVATLPESVSPLHVEAHPASVEIRTGDEIEDLARTFQSMRRALEDSLLTIRTQPAE